MKILACLVLLFVATASFGGGSAVGAGGSVIRLPNGDVVPADLYYKEHNFELPPYYQGKLTKEEFPELFQEFDGILDSARTMGWEIFGQYYPNNWGTKILLELEDFEIYLSSHLSGDDSFDVEGSQPTEQVAFTYWFNDTSHGVENVHLRKLIEVKTDLFKQLSARNQAFIIIHEMLHHLEKTDHALISPLIRSLSIALRLKESQLSGGDIQASPEEFQASRKLAGFASLRGYFDFKDVTFHPKTAGWLAGNLFPNWTEWDVTMGSNVKVDHDVPALKSVTARNSAVRIWNFASKTGCGRMRFVDSRVKVRCDGGGDHTIENVNADSVANDPQPLMHLSLGGASSFFKNVHIGESRIFECLGSNHIENLNVRGSAQTQIGVGTRFENANLDSMGWRFGPNNLIRNVTVGSINGEKLENTIWENIDANVSLHTNERGVIVRGLRLKSPDSQTGLRFKGKNSAFNFDPNRTYKLKPATTLPRTITLKKVTDLDKWVE